MAMLTHSEKIDAETHIRLLRTMVLIRKFEEKIIEVYADQDMKTPVHLCIGQEAVAAGVCAELTPHDYVLTNHRNHGHCLAKGADPKILYAEFYGRVTGCCGGKGGSMHPAIPEAGIPGTSAIVGGGIPLAVGTALASRLKGENRVSVAFFGDGAADQGVFHESLNFASLKKLPVVFVCENNFYATNSPLSARQPHEDIAKRAEGYQMPGVSIQGADVTGIYLEAQAAVERARNGAGPTLIECKTYRWRGHVGPECDVEKGCRPKEELLEWMQKCPVETYKNYLMQQKLIDSSRFAEISDEISLKIDSALQFARQSPFPQEESLLNHVYHVRNRPCPGPECS